MASAWSTSWGFAWGASWGAITVEQALLANDVTSASSVTQPLLGVIAEGSFFAEDVISASSVTTPALGQGYGLLAEDVTSASSVSVPLLGEIEAGTILAEDVVSASFVSTPTLAVEGEGQPGLPMGGASAGGYGYYRRRRPEDEEEDRKERKRREERIRDLAEAIDRAVARAQAQLETTEDEASGAETPEVEAIEDALEAIQDRVRQIEALGTRILQADAELEALRQEAVDLILEAELDDDDEALELLLAA